MSLHKHLMIALIQSYYLPCTASVCYSQTHCSLYIVLLWNNQVLWSSKVRLLVTTDFFVLLQHSIFDFLSGFLYEYILAFNATNSSAISRRLLELVYRFGRPKYEPKKSKSSFFIKQTINSFLLCELYRKLDTLDAYLWI